MVLCGVVCAGLAAGMAVMRKKAVWQKIRSPCIVLVVFGVLGFLAAVSEETRENGFENGLIARKEPGEGELETEANVYFKEEDVQYPVTVTIEERRYRKAEEEKLLSGAVKEMKETFCGKNESLEKIILNPVVSDCYQDGAVTAEWTFSETDVITPDGEIRPEALKMGRQKVEALVSLKCGSSEMFYEFAFWISSQKKSKQEELLFKLNEQIAAQETTEEYVRLPDEVDGRKIEWREPASGQSFEILGLGALAAFAAFYAAGEQKKKQERKRKQKLLLAYPEFVSKLSLLLGAGMSISGALRKMNDMYQRKKRNGKEEEAYEELYRMVCEMDNGRGEIKAYQEFSERCDAQPYRKLVALLIAGQRVGSRRLMERLNEEADRVFAERKNAARRLGEEAGTKMLLPMMMMLIIVMGIVMAPAFLSIYQK